MNNELEKLIENVKEFSLTKEEKILMCENVSNFIKDNEKVAKYIIQGKSEILWYDKRLNLFQFIQEVEHTMPEAVKKIATKMFAQITDEKIDLLVQNADNCLLGKNHETYLTSKRKFLIQTLLKQRLKFLKETIHID